MTLQCDTVGKHNDEVLVVCACVRVCVCACVRACVRASERACTNKNQLIKCHGIHKLSTKHTPRHCPFHVIVAITCIVQMSRWTLSCLVFSVSGNVQHHLYKQLYLHYINT